MALSFGKKLEENAFLHHLTSDHRVDRKVKRGSKVSMNHLQKRKLVGKEEKDIVGYVVRRDITQESVHVRYYQDSFLIFFFYFFLVYVQVLLYCLLCVILV